MIEQDNNAEVENPENQDKDSFKLIQFTEELRNVYRALQKWIDINDDKVFYYLLTFDCFFVAQIKNFNSTKGVQVCS